MVTKKQTKYQLYWINTARHTDGLVSLFALYHPEYGYQTWRQIQVRKIIPCCICEKPIGTVAYKPITNKKNRDHRICDRHIRIDIPIFNKEMESK